jgi:hypothetical protein
MSKQERTRKSSPQNRVKSFVDVQEEVKPTQLLNSEQLRWFSSIIDSRERSTWLPADIGAATQLAKLQCTYEQQMNEAVDDGLIEDGVINPRLKAADILFSQIDKACRRLGLTASQRGVSGHKQAKRNQQDSQAKATTSNISSLINRPNG